MVVSVPMYASASIKVMFQLNPLCCTSYPVKFVVNVSCCTSHLIIRVRCVTAATQPGVEMHQIACPC